MKPFAFIAAMLMFSICVAEDDYQVFKKTCPYTDYYCRRDWNEKKADERAAKYSEEARARAAETAQRRKEEAAEREAKIAADRQKREAKNEAAIERTRRQIESSERRELAAQKAAVVKENDTKNRCGDDYRRPRIGMTVVRAQECVGKFSMTGQINRADGVISTYMGSGMFLHVMDGKVVSWGRY